MRFQEPESLDRLCLVVCREEFEPQFKSEPTWADLAKELGVDTLGG
jgi:hypothetical protein